jgi:hypothetical protein
MPLNYARIALAVLGATVAYFVLGFALFAALPAMKSEFMKYPNVYRSHDASACPSEPSPPIGGRPASA